MKNYFRVSARTLFHLGADLIGSDGIAFYEIIKNAFDARSRSVKITLARRVSHEVVLALAGSLRELIIQGRLNKGAKLNEQQQEAFEDFRQHYAASLDKAVSDHEAYVALGLEAQTPEQLLMLVEDANSIEFLDVGSGMSVETLTTDFMTLGTNFRIRDREENPDRAILGEKGIGRLSAMRLGNILEVRTTTAGDTHWSVLRIDWSDFQSPDATLEEVAVAPVLRVKKTKKDESGTRITIAALTSEWTQERLRLLVSEQFSRILDPFAPQTQFRVSVKYNDEPVPIPSLSKALFAAAHATLSAEYRVEGDSPVLIGEISYAQKHRSKPFALAAIDLLEVASVKAIGDLIALGPFTVEMYWYNRKHLEAIDAIGDRQFVKNLQAQWAGGLMVFRDGFRVHPYGDPEDDWLSLDKRALASSGFKVNRRQIIGRVVISSKGNPKLVDQTNRQGLRDGSAKTALTGLLRHVLEVHFRGFLNQVDAQQKASVPVRFDELEAKIRTSEKRLQSAVSQLVRTHPAVKENEELTAAINLAVSDLRENVGRAKALVASYEEGHQQLVHLAGVGLMVEILVHEFSRLAGNSLESVKKVQKLTDDDKAASILDVLSSQLKSLSKRLRVIDPVSTASRQRKEEFDLSEWVTEIVNSHSDEMLREGIALHQKRVGGTALPVKMVKGMVVQVVENIISNAVYWLRRTRLRDTKFKPEIFVQIDCKSRAVSISDNGPGVDPALQDEIFQPFFTTKPPGEGKGLGLYIARTIAEYHGMHLYLSDEEDKAGRLHRFVLAVEGRE